ncbi:RagB/SusD family nutrient uptake outer membrane protein [uncultured Proteiniphilum sp.]|uniref:RagB/SusD family nutrient uptake outer membrane protein n=1 Tax=uncultured Proteiniphilum sp. TaxID=497637 RepID=UPI0026184464|nr:RagB/SusD family nutrient uptake outer membrane protein [uncultured Proteiniphilum sp.]
MKKIIKYYKITFTLALIAIFCGCSDFLEFKPYGPITSDTFWQTEDDLKAALNAFYDYTYWEGTTGRGVYWFENCSDDMVTGRVNATADACKNFQMAANSGLDVSDTWPRFYQVIAKSNDILRYVPNMHVSESLKDRAIAEGYFFRGYAYLWLAPWYGDNGPNGGIPVITEETTVEELDMPRPLTVLENYDLIISDLRKAGDLLPALSEQAKTDYGRPHKAAAWAFAARAALYASQYDNKYFDIVIEMCDKVINMTGSDKRDLYPDFTKLFRRENNFSGEYIYSILGNATEGPKFHGMGFQNGGFGIYNTWGYFQPTLELYNAYAPGDVRRDATILFPNQHITFVGRDIHWAVNPSEVSSTSGMTGRKFMSIFEAADCIGTVVNTSGNNQSNELGMVVMRYADVLLMKAEALIWKNGEGDAGAKSLLNQIRKRAGLAENSSATKAELKNERRCELALEFLPSRHFDLVRWGDARTVYAKSLHGVKTILKNGAFDRVEEIECWPARTFNPNVHHVFPIPSVQIAKSNGILKQNQGY